MRAKCRFDPKKSSKTAELAYGIVIPYALLLIAIRRKLGSREAGFSLVSREAPHPAA